MRVSERQMRKTMHRPGVIDLGRGSGIGINVRREPRRPEIPWIQVVVQLVDGILVGGVCVSVSPRLGGGQK